MHTAASFEVNGRVLASIDSGFSFGLAIKLQTERVVAAVVLIPFLWKVLIVPTST